MDAAEPYQDLANSLNNPSQIGKYMIQYGGTTLSIVDPKRIRNGLNVNEMELKIRKQTFQAIMSTYADLNTNATPHDEIAVYTYEYTIPGWYPIPVFPSRIFTGPYPSKYNTLTDIVIPQFNQTMDQALASLKIQSGWKMECTAAQKIVEYSIINTLMKDFADELLSTEYLDRRIADGRLYSSIRGYEGRNRRFAEAYLARGVITQDVANSMLLDEQKTKRMFAFISLVDALYILKDDSDHELRTGDKSYIWGHPDYLDVHPDGSYRGENVFCIGYNDRGLKLFMGYGKNFATGPKQLKEIQASLALEHLGLSEYPEGYKDEMERIILKRGPQPTSDFATAFAAIRSRKQVGIQILNIKAIQSFSDDDESTAGGSRKRKSTRRHKRQRRSTVKRRNLAVRRTRRA